MQCQVHVCNAVSEGRATRMLGRACWGAALLRDDAGSTASSRTHSSAWASRRFALTGQAGTSRPDSVVQGREKQLGRCSLVMGGDEVTFPVAIPLRSRYDMIC